MAEMARIPAKRSAESVSETVSSFGGSVAVVIDWKIRNSSCLKAQMTPLESDRTIVGSSAWSIVLHPLSESCRKDSLPDGTDVFVQHDFLGNKLTKISAEIFISVLGGKNGDEDQLRKYMSSSFSCRFGERSLLTEKNNGSGKEPYLFKHDDIWGAKPTLRLHDDTLRLRVTVTYSPPKLTALDRMRTVEPLQKKYRAVFNSDVGKDFVLVSSDGTKRSAHRALLDQSSPFFSAMLQSGMTETQLGQCEMPDISTETLDFLLRFMYYDCTEGLNDSARTIIVAADKYQIDDLKKSCEDILIAELASGTAADLLLLADKLSASSLKDAALRYITGNFKAMAECDEIKKLSPLAEDIFAAVARWGTK